jgi:hypothetical protein
MDSLFQNSSGEKSEHPPREMLLLFVDGELSAKGASQLETHLEACWPCRVKTKKIQEAIADIIEFDEQVLTPRLLPPKGWRNFDRRLNRLAAASGKQSLRSRLFGSLGRFLPTSHLVALPRPLLRPMLRNAAAVLVVILIVALVIRLKYEPTVSANELLKNAIEAQSRRSLAFDEAVLHQKLHVSRKGQGSAHQDSVNLEIWDDTKNSRVRQFLTDGKQTIPVPTSLAPKRDGIKETTTADVLNDLAQVLQANHMDPLRPLSAASYQSWRSTLQHQQDQVTKSRLSDGNDALNLRTVLAAPVNMGQIAEAVLTVRARDWQPTQLLLNVAAEGGNHIYELTETISEVVSLAQINPAIFHEQLIVSPSPAGTPKEHARKETQPGPDLNVDPPSLTARQMATAELEVEALNLLSKVGADLGEQISVKRMADGMLHIGGIVETEQRKSEIINALRPVASNSAVRIEVQTVTEAVAKQTTAKATPSPRVRQVEITGNTMAAEAELRAYFAGKGKDTDDAVRQYAARMVNLSGQAMDHLWAMKRLLNQFSTEQVRSLTPSARAKWLSLVRAHARSYQRISESLSSELRPVFFPRQSPAAVSSAATEITDTDKLSRAVEQLFELGSSNDRVVRSAFTSSSGGVMTTIIKAPQFWESLKNAEALAGRIQSAIDRL